VWERSPSTATVGYFAGVIQCLNNTAGGRKGWRVPSIFELSTLIDPTVTVYPLLPGSSVQERAEAWLLLLEFHARLEYAEPLQWGTNTFDGAVNQYFLTTAGLRVWCVRAPSADSLQ